MNFRIHSMTYALIFLLAACAPVSQLPQVDSDAVKREEEIQRSLVLRQAIEHRARLNRVAFPVLQAGAPLCREKGHTARKVGIDVLDKYTFPSNDRKTMEATFGYGDDVQVISVAPGSPADRAGMREGDVLVRLGDWPVPAGSDAIKTLTARYVEMASTEAEIATTVRRGGKEITLQVPVEEVCKYSYSVEAKHEVNAFADGERIVFAHGMMDFARTDEELAIVVGHEIAHNLMDHISKTQGNALLGSVVDILFAGFGVNTHGAFGNMAGMAYSQDFESEADYVGLYLAARAGFDISKSPDFWRRMGVKHPGSIKSNHAASHPATPHRFIALEKTVAEINAKKSQRLPLEPEKGRQESPPALVESGTDQQ